MRYVKLGHTGLDVSPICIGAMTYGEPVPAAIRSGALRRGSRADPTDPGSAIEAGVNFFDTANMYSQGSPARRYSAGRSRVSHNRDDIVIATKGCGIPCGPGPMARGLSRKAIMTEIDHSLRRLGTNFVDLYQIHRMGLRPRRWKRHWRHCIDLVKAGEVRYLGASSMHAWEFKQSATTFKRAHRWARFVWMPSHYNLLAREEEREMLPLCADEGVGTIVWSPPRTRASRPPLGQSTPRSEADPFAEMLYVDEASDRAIVEAAGQIAYERGASRAQIALAWLRRNPVVVAPILGASKASHIDEAIAALSIDLSDGRSRLERPYTPRHDFQGISDPARLARISARIGIRPMQSRGGIQRPMSKCRPYSQPVGSCCNFLGMFLPKIAFCIHSFT